MLTTLGVSKEHITKTPGVCGGRACIAGHRIRVMDIVILHEQRGLSATEIVAMYPHITMADVHAALTYAYDNRGEIDFDLLDSEEVAERYRSLFPSKLASQPVSVSG